MENQLLNMHKEGNRKPQKRDKKLQPFTLAMTLSHTINSSGEFRAENTFPLQLSLWLDDNVMMMILYLLLLYEYEYIY